MSAKASDWMWIAIMCSSYIYFVYMMADESTINMLQ